MTLHTRILYDLILMSFDDFRFVARSSCLTCIRAASSIVWTTPPAYFRLSAIRLVVYTKTFFGIVCLSVVRLGHHYTIGELLVCSNEKLAQKCLYQRPNDKKFWTNNRQLIVDACKRLTLNIPVCTQKIALFEKILAFSAWSNASSPCDLLLAASLLGSSSLPIVATHYD